MAGVVTATATLSACGRERSLTITLNGVEYSIPHMHEVDAAIPLSDAERDDVLRALVRLVCTTKSLTLATLLNRVVLGEEATNVKPYTLFGPGLAITKTNIGTSYVDIITAEANGGRMLVDFTGVTKIRPVVRGDLPGTGPYSIRIVKDSDNTVLFEQTGITANGNPRELDPGWQDIPAGFTSELAVRVQARSNTGSDDPVFRAAVLLVK